jgi:hypothetical protein
MGRAAGRRRGIVLAAALAVGLCSTGAAHAATAWRVQPAPPGGLDARKNLWLDVDGGFATLSGSVGSGVFKASQKWGLRRVGGTVQQPWYQVYNLAFDGCLEKALNIPTPQVFFRRCRAQGTGHIRTDWWQFTSLTNQPGNPGLTQAGTGPRLWVIHGFYETSGNCMAVANGDYRAGIRLAMEGCNRSAGQQWWLYRTTAP